MKIHNILCNPSNYRKGRSQRIGYLVIHYTANNGDTAQGNGQYFARQPNLNASAHYFIDENEAVQSVPDTDTAWHCGGGRQGKTGGSLLGICTNSNSIGIELCSRVANGEYYFKNGTIENAVNLVRMKMAEYGIPSERVIRHFDVTGKICPRPFVDDENAWRKFKEKLTETEEPELIYDYIDENMPKWAHEAVQWAVDNGIVKGTGEGLGLDDKDLKNLVWLYRAHRLK